MRKGVVPSVVAALVAAMLTANPATAASVCANSDVSSYPPPATDAPSGITAGSGGIWHRESDSIVRIRAIYQVDRPCGYVVDLNFVLVPSNRMPLRSLA